jgi:hypothetical protein
MEYYSEEKKDRELSMTLTKLKKIDRWLLTKDLTLYLQSKIQRSSVIQSTADLFSTLDNGDPSGSKQCQWFAARYWLGEFHFGSKPNS